MTVVLWDLDGTIQDSEGLAREGTRHGFKEVLGREPTEDEFKQLMGRPVPIVYKEWFDDVLAQRIYDTGTSYYREHAEQISCYTHVPELLNELKQRGYRMGVVSAKRRFNVVRELKFKELDAFFEIVIAQEDTLLHKPDPAPLLLAANQMNVSPVNCVYIGDQPTDIEAAHSAGMQSIAALWGDGKAERLQSKRPTMMADNPADILTLLSKKAEVEGGK